MVNINFIEELKNLRNFGKSDKLEELGYKLIKQNNNYHYVYINDTNKKVIVAILGFEIEYSKLILELLNPSNIFNFNENNSKFLKIINHLIMRLKEGTTFINNSRNNYTEYEVTFLGNSIGGFLINNNLQNTSFKCYTYNPAFINKNINNNNIVNYRISGDFVSLAYIFDKDTKIIEVTFIEYLLKNDLIKNNLQEFNLNNFINYIINSHYLDFLDDYKNKEPEIDIP